MAAAVKDPLVFLLFYWKGEQQILQIHYTLTDKSLISIHFFI